MATEVADWTQAPRWALVVTIATLYGLACTSIGCSVTLLQHRFDQIESMQKEAPTKTEAGILQEQAEQRAQIRFMREALTATDTRMNKLIEMQTETTRLLGKIVDGKGR